MGPLTRHGERLLPVKVLPRNIVGAILGTAVGDSLGLPYEGLSSRRAARLLGPPDRHRFFLGRGMVSDDTEHTCFVAQALMASRFDPARFSRHLAGQLRWWLLGLPAGVGLATLKAALRLWVGFSPEKSGVFSAGNGPAMRSALLGLVFQEDPVALREFVRRSTVMTHTDPKALQGALAVALAAGMSTMDAPPSPSGYNASLRDMLGDDDADEFLSLIDRACESANRGVSVAFFAERLGSMKGISGYALHTVPCVIQTWLRFCDDYAGGVKEIICAGGDTDTTAAILGGIIGARVGREGIPGEWVDGIIEWPRSIEWMQRLGKQLHQAIHGDDARPPSYFSPAVFPRNIFFLFVILFHGLRRSLPPY